MTNRQTTFEDVFNEPKKEIRVKRGRIVTIEQVESELWAISTEFHDAYLYDGKTIEEAIANYEDDRECQVAEWHIYERGN